MDTEGARVAEEIEAPPSSRPLADRTSGRPVIEEETDVQLVGEVDLEAKSMLDDGLDHLSAVQAFVLGSLAVLRDLTSAVSDVETFPGDVEAREDLRLDIPEMGNLLFESVVAASMEEPGDGVTLGRGGGRLQPRACSTGARTMLKINGKTITGLGDAVEAFNEATGIKKAVETISEKTGRDCGCGKRKEWLNRAVPFGSERRISAVRKSKAPQPPEPEDPPSGSPDLSR